MLELPSPCLVVLIGVAGSGKTTWAQQNLAPHVVSSDALRALVGEGEHDLRASTDAFHVLAEVVDRRLRRGLTTVIDSLGNDAVRRQQWREIATRHGVPSVALLFDVTPARTRRQNRARRPRVPDTVLAKQLSNWSQLVDEVRAEPFAHVHLVQPEEQPELVPSELLSRSPAKRTAPAVPDRVVAPRQLSFGLQIPQYTWPSGPDGISFHLRDVVARAEAAGFETVWVMDHFRQIPSMGPAWHDMLESWTTLAFLAACTDTMRLGTLVSGITYRNVAHLGKIAATLDVLSGGRVTCGLGTAWFEDEHRAYGWPFPSRADRYALLEDALQLLPRLWGPGSKPFEGHVLAVPDTTCYPRPLQARLPILIGGSGERRTLRLVAQYADACNLFGDATTVSTKVAVLHQHCRDVGRDATEVSVSHLSTVLVGSDSAHVRELVETSRPERVAAERFARSVNAGTTDQHVGRIERFIDAGVDQVIVSLADLADAQAVDRYGAVIESCRRRGW